MTFGTDNINQMIIKYKKEYRDYEKNCENELISICLQNKSGKVKFWRKMAMEQLEQNKFFNYFQIKHEKLKKLKSSMFRINF